LGRKLRGRPNPAEVDGDERHPLPR
jgi:hypothetical protein